MGSSRSPLSLRILLITAGVLSVSMATKLYFPAILNFAVYDIPVIWSVILSWLKPPYLFVVINGIIITIAASSRFHHHYNNYHSDYQSQPLINETDSLPSPDLASELPPMSIQTTFVALEHPAVVYESELRETEESSVVYESEPPVVDIETVPVNDSDVSAESEDKSVISRSAWNSPQDIINSPPSDFNFPVREKPLVSSRFAHQRRSAKINPEGVKSLRVSKPRKHETLESTWKTITDGRHIPLNRHLRHHVPPSDVFSGEQAAPLMAEDIDVMNKSETFNDRTDSDLNNQIQLMKNSLQSGWKLRKEGSLSHDELNRRVEAFIQKFNEEMRLQRQESLQRYMDMINRGAQ